MSNFKKSVLILVVIAVVVTLISCKDELNDYITISELIETCGLPGECKVPLPCEGKEIKIGGFIDYRNVFDKEHYPQLPYEKFKLNSEKGNQSIEIWAVGEDNTALFKKIDENNVDPPRIVFIEGKVEGVDLPTNDGCQRWVKMLIDNEEDIIFKENK